MSKQTKQLKAYFIDSLKQLGLIKSKERFLLAISGGVDSVVLADLFTDSNFDIAIAHVNYQLRGYESDRDELFVRSIAEKYNCPIYVIQFDTLKESAISKKSIQETARDLRYRWMKEIALEKGFAFVVTAHHLNDNIETVLFNLINGTGIKGLTGIPLKNENVIRPLVKISKEQLFLYSKERNLTFREDSSNLSNKYDRNKIRNKIIPQLKEINPSFEKVLSQSLSNFIEINEVYNWAIENLKNDVIVKDRNLNKIVVRKLLKYSFYRSILFEILKEYNFSSAQIRDISNSFPLESGRIFHSSSNRLISDRHHLWIVPITENDLQEMFIVDENLRSINLNKVKMKFEKTNKLTKDLKNKSHAFLNMKKIEFPIIIRKWKRGDYFYPYGMKKPNSGKVGKKKISDFFTDMKIPLHEKEEIWILESANRIAWVVSHRTDDRFKVEETTNEILHVSISQ